MKRLAFFLIGMALCVASQATTTIRIMTTFTTEGKAYVEAHGSTTSSTVAQELAKTNNVFFISNIDAIVTNAGIALGICCGNANYLAPWNLMEEATDALDWASKSLGVAMARDAAAADAVFIISHYTDDISGRSFGWKGPYKALFAVDADSLDDYATTHELGHTMGAHHQQSGGNPAGSNDGRSDPYIYAHGYWFRSTTYGCFHTLMSAPSAPDGNTCLSDLYLSRFSNQNQTIQLIGPGGSGYFPLGGNFNNNAAALNNTKSQVASYRTYSWVKKYNFAAMFGPMIATFLLEP